MTQNHLTITILISFKLTFYSIILSLNMRTSSFVLSILIFISISSINSINENDTVSVHNFSNYTENDRHDLLKAIMIKRAHNLLEEIKHHEIPDFEERLSEVIEILSDYHSSNDTSIERKLKFSKDLYDKGYLDPDLLALAKYHKSKLIDVFHLRGFLVDQKEKREKESKTKRNLQVTGYNLDQPYKYPSDYDLRTYYVLAGYCERIEPYDESRPQSWKYNCGLYLISGCEKYYTCNINGGLVFGTVHTSDKTELQVCNCLYGMGCHVGSYCDTWEAQVTSFYLLLKRSYYSVSTMKLYKFALTENGMCSLIPPESGIPFPPYYTQEFIDHVLPRLLPNMCPEVNFQT